jgi:hypothetical protein
MVNAMAWSAPERRWRFGIGDDPPGEIPASWASATRAVTRDLSCRRHGRPISFCNVMWTIQVDHGFVSVGFALAGDADLGAYSRCKSYRLVTTAAQAAVWMADDIHEELAGYEFVQWPIANQRILDPRLVDDQAVWLDPATGAIVASIGGLCAGG